MNNDINKDILYLLNETQIDLDKLDKDDFTDIESKKIKKNFRKSIKKRDKHYNLKKFVIAASVIVLSVSFLSSSIGGQIWANIAIVTKDMASILGINNDIDKYSTIVNKEITKHGITVKLNEVILDDDELIVSSSFVSDKKVKDYLISNESIYVNGKSISSGARGGGIDIDEYTRQYVMKNDLSTPISKSDDIDFKIVFDNIERDGKSIPGNWTFEFKANGSELEKTTQKMNLKQEININKNEKLTLEKYKRNDLGDKIYFSYNHSRGTLYDIKLTGKDDLGNKVEFYLASSDKDGGFFENENIESVIDETATKLTLTPYAVKMPEKSGKMPNDFKKVGEPFTIDLTKLSTSK